MSIDPSVSCAPRSGCRMSLAESEVSMVVHQVAPPSTFGHSKANRPTTRSASSPSGGSQKAFYLDFFFAQVFARMRTTMHRKVARAMKDHVAAIVSSRSVKTIRGANTIKKTPIRPRRRFILIFAFSSGEAVFYPAIRLSPLPRRTIMPIMTRRAAIIM